MAVMLLVASSCGGATKAGPPEAPGAPVAQAMSRSAIRALRQSPRSGVVIGSQGSRSTRLPLEAMSTGRVPGPRGLVRVQLASPHRTSESADRRRAVAVARTAALGALGRPVVTLAGSATGAISSDSGAALGVAFLAAHLGTEVTQGTVVLGSVTADGRLIDGPEHEQQLRSVALRFARVIVPAGSARPVDLGSAEVVPARNLVEAYRAATGKQLPQTEAVVAAEQQSSKTSQLLTRSLDALRNDIASFYPDLLRIETAGRLPKRLDELGASALAHVREAEGHAAANRDLSAWAHLRQAAHEGHAAVTTYRVLLALQREKTDEAVALLEQERDRIADRLGQTSEARPGLAGQLLEVGAAAARYRGHSWLRKADLWLGMVGGYLEARAKSKTTGPFSFDTADELVEHLLPVAVALARANDHSTSAALVDELRVRTLLPAAPAAALAALTEHLESLGPPQVPTQEPDTPAAPEEPPEDAKAPETAPPLSEVLPEGWSKRALEHLSSEDGVIADGPPLATDATPAQGLGRALARVPAGANQSPSDAQLASASSQARRHAHRASIVLGSVPAEVLWLLSASDALAASKQADKGVRLSLATKASLLGIIAVELALWGRTSDSQIPVDKQLRPQ